ncbi:hypothetical protein JOL79_00530 [Microbispora sp. RL4-1S]|uniref:Uncharacterized protein n=1 Tax=Microbispora oryzae TaxID=2806554 RepID=A0A940WKN7_9ACTN|nr:hypothetical protein [Microbispora oryzae]MBP2702279.1 hypothetical protein [Microbispora oryzae]
MTKRKRRPTAPAERWTGSALSEFGLSEGQQKVLRWGGSVVGLIALALVLTLTVNAFAGGQTAASPAQPDSALGQARPSAFQAWPQVKEFAPIADRKADGSPLTVQELFGARTLSSGKVTLRRIAGRLDPGCASVVWGEALAGALSSAGCTQAVRGLYATANGVYVAQYTMFNLADEQAANEFVQSLDTLYRGGWVRPLESQKAAFGAYSEGSAQAMGHYAGVIWIGRSDGAEPGEKDDFVMLGLAVRSAEKALFRRVVKVAGLPDVTAAPGPGDTAQPSEAAPTDPGTTTSTTPGTTTGTTTGSPGTGTGTGTAAATPSEPPQ